MILMVGYLMMRIYWIPGAAAKCSVETIAKMQHYVCIVFGDSEAYYGGDKWTNLGGMFPHEYGQGNGDGPALWAAISSLLLQILREQGFGIEFLSAISLEILILAAFGKLSSMTLFHPSRTQQKRDYQVSTLELKKISTRVFSELKLRDILTVQSN